jgi:hypothetical protein
LGRKENVWVSQDETDNASGRKAADIIIVVRKKQSTAIREIISSVMAESVCSKSCNSKTCFH